LQSGDVCYVAAGSYAQSINPANAGSGPATRISFIGNLANPGAVVVAGISVSKAYVSVKGFKATSGLTLEYPARNDSVAYCTLSWVGFEGAKYAMVARNTINGYLLFAANGGRGCYVAQTLDAGCVANSEYDTLRANTINLGTIKPGAKAWTLHAWTQHCQVDSN